MWVAGKVLSLHLKLLDIDHPLAFEQSKLRQIEDHALIYPSRPKRSKNPTRCSLYKGDSPPPPFWPEIQRRYKTSRAGTTQG